MFALKNNNSFRGVFFINSKMFTKVLADNAGLNLKKKKKITRLFLLNFEYCTGKP